ncbi:hypothetical protein [Streptomyces sp. NPDC057257]|uniref:hypothetical protein n=1 Tax=Streptomyces sp. NPDC057257 TaxID=3346071 RepID=UPI003642396E
MKLWAVCACLTGYVLCALAAARCSYGVQRTRHIAQESRRVGCTDPVARFESHSRDTAAAAFVFGLAWPLTVPCYGAFRLSRFLIMANPPETSFERARRTERLRADIEDLEEELGMGRNDARRPNRSVPARWRHLDARPSHSAREPRAPRVSPEHQVRPHRSGA